MKIPEYEQNSRTHGTYVMNKMRMEIPVTPLAREG
jgi:hypothetical protein